MSQNKLTEKEDAKRERMFVNYFYLLDETEQELLLRGMYDTLPNKVRSKIYESMLKYKYVADKTSQKTDLERFLEFPLDIK
jgi:hypothetical protein